MWRPSLGAFVRYASGLMVPFQATAEHVGAPTRGTLTSAPQSVYAVRK